MLRTKVPSFLYIICLLFIGCEKDSHSTALDSDLKDQKVKSSLPMMSMGLMDLSSFKSAGENWSVGESIYADYTDENSFVAQDGKGILINKMVDGKNTTIETEFDHGDLELSFEFLMPKKSNSGIYFQDRYELQLADSYGKEKLTVAEIGSIYERWDDTKSEGNKGYDGHPPLLNACKAPGLWQQMKIYFRAPKFDKNGVKTNNAKFDYVYLNGIKIQDNVELTGPTRGGKEKELPFAPLVIQGDHGNVAFRNIKYKSFSQDSLTLQNISYRYFEHPHGISFPEFDTVSILKEGTADFLDVNIANAKEDHYGLIFNGSLKVPVSGEYLFKTGIDDGGDLLIDKKLVVHNDGDPGFGNAYGIVDLEEGEHDFEVRFYDNVWNARLNIEYEGPGIYKHTLSQKAENKTARKPTPPLTIEAIEETELLRSFAMYKGKKRTHVISVGSPAGLHYTYDLSEGALLKYWRGEFADVTDMWRGRGQPQIIKPLNASIEAVDGLPILGHKMEDLVFLGYDLNDKGEPVFKYKLDNLQWTDQIAPSSDGKMLERTIKTNGKVTLRIAQADKIEKLPHGLFSIDGQFYLDAVDAVIQEDELHLTTDAEGKLSYKLLW